MHKRGVELIGGRMPTRQALRHYIDVSANPTSIFQPYLEVSGTNGSTKYELNDAGYDLQILARYRIVHGLHNKVPIAELFGERDNPLAFCKYLIHAAAKEGVKTIQELADSSGVSPKTSRMFLHQLAKYGLAVETEVKNGKGVRLAMNSNGPLSKYVQGIELMLTYMKNPKNMVNRFEVERQTLTPDRLPDAIRVYEVATQRNWC